MPTFFSAMRAVIDWPGVLAPGESSSVASSSEVLRRISLGFVTAASIGPSFEDCTRMPPTGMRSRTVAVSVTAPAVTMETNSRSPPAPSARDSVGLVQ